MPRLFAAVLAAPVRPVTYLRVVFVLVGSAVALAFALLDTTLIALLPQWFGLPLVIATAVVITAAPPSLLGLLPAVRQLEGVAAEALLGVRFPAGPPGPARDFGERLRGVTWFWLHLLAGGILVAAVVFATVLAGPLGVLPVALLAIGLGALLARLAPLLLGPSHAERLQRLEAEAARLAERGRLARELHDSIGHALSLVTLQAGAARKVLGRDPAFVDGALRAIESTSRAATADLDHMLGLLRDNSPAGSETGETETSGADATTAPRRSPTPGLDAVPSLVAATRAAGLELEVSIAGDPSGLPGVVSREAYRIVQEGLTNALRHASARTAALCITQAPDRLLITLTNPVGRGGVGSPRNLNRDRERRMRGRGLSGIAERVAALGGSVDSGADGSTWRLVIELPVPLHSPAQSEGAA